MNFELLRLMLDKNAKQQSSVSVYRDNRLVLIVIQSNLSILEKPKINRALVGFILVCEQ